MGVRRRMTTALALVACVHLPGCASDEAVSSGGDCVSRYDPVASAATWRQMRSAMLDRTDLGEVDRVRVQARGQDLGSSDEDVVRVVDLLDDSGKRIVQVDVWRGEDGGWRAGVWHQCID